MTNADDLLDAFDLAWAESLRTGATPPEISEYRIVGTSSEANRHWEQLAEIDLDYRWRFLSAANHRDHNPGPLPSLRHYFSPQNASETATVCSSDLVAFAYHLYRQHDQAVKASEFLCWAADRDHAEQVLGRVDAEFDAAKAKDSDSKPSASHSSHPHLPDFELEHVIGRGGKGVVYKARQLSVDRTVAVKTIPASNTAYLTDLQRLQNEAQILGSLQHPNIVTVYSMEQGEDGRFLVMEYVSGKDLSVLQREGNISPADAARFMLAVAQAIHTAHSRHVLHRDIKPSNILLDDEGNIRVTDFGLSRRLESSGTSDPLTATSEVLGTPGYISPEQAQGRNRQLDETADVYGIGATLYSLLVGVAPFTGPTVINILRQVCERPPTAPRLIRPDIPRDLETICLKCMEKRPADRYPNALALAQDLERFLDGHPIKARPIGLLRRGVRWYRRNQIVAALLLSVGGLTLAMVGFLIVRDHENEQSLSTISLQKDQLEQALKRQQAASLEAYDNKIRRIRLEYDSNELRNVESILASLKKHYAADDSLPWEARYLSSLLNASEHHWEMTLPQAEWIGALAFSPDGSQLAIGNSAPHFDSQKRGAAGRVTLRNVETGRVLHEIIDVLSISDLLFSSDGSVLMAVESDIGFEHGTVHGDATIRRWSTTDWTELPPIHARRPLLAAYLATDPTTLLATQPVHGDGRLVVIDLQNNRVTAVYDHWEPDSESFAIRAWKEEDTPVTISLEVANLASNRAWPRPHFAVHTDRHRVEVNVATAETGRVSVSVFRKQQNSLVRTLEWPFVETLTLGPQDHQLAIASGHGEIRVRDTATWAELPPLRGHRAHIRSLTFSPDGQRLASGDWDGHVRVWKLSQPPGSVDTGVPLRGKRLEAFALNDKGQIMSLVTDRPLQTFELGSETSVRDCRIPYPNHGLSPGRRADLSKNGTLIAVPAPEDESLVELRNTESGNVTSQLPGHSSRVAFVRIFGDLVACASWKSGLFEPPVETDGEIRLSSVSGEEVFATTVKAARIYRLALSADRRYLAASCERFHDGKSGSFVRTWEIPSGKEIDTVAADSWVLALEFHPHQNVYSMFEFDSGDFITRDVMHSRSPTVVADLMPEVQDLCFSPDGTRLAGVTRRKMVLWDVANRKQVMDFPLTTFEADFVFNPRVRFSPDGGMILANQPDGTVRSWGTVGRDD